MSTRRTFLKNTAAIAAGAFASPFIMPAHAQGANDKIRLALIGCGGRGMVTCVPCCKNNPNVEIRAVCDPNRAQLANAAKSVEKDFGKAPAAEEDLRKVLENKEIDAVWIATPEHWHCVAGVWACQAGKDVYVEKNLSVNIWESRKLVEAAAKYKRVVQMGFQNRSASQGFSARDYIKEGKLGKVVTVKTYYMLGGGKFTEAAEQPAPDWLNWDLWQGPAPARPFSPSIVSKGGRGGWQKYWAYSGGQLDDEASHTLDFTRMVLGDPPHPKSVYGWGGNTAYGGTSEVPEVQSLLFDFGDFTLSADGGSAFPYMGKAGNDIRYNAEKFPNWRNYSARVEIYGTKGLMYLGRHGGGWQVIGGGDKIVAQDGAVFPDDAHQKNFIECIRSRQTPNGNIEEGHKSATLVNMGNIACRVGNKQLLFDGKKETFIGSDSAVEKANVLARGSHRKGYEIAERG